MQELHTGTGIPPENGSMTIFSWNNLKYFKFILGTILVILGSLMSVWVFKNIYHIFTDPETEIQVFKHFISSAPESRTMEFEGKEIILPEGIFHFFSYLTTCLLLFIVAIIAGTILTGGINLIQPSLQRFESRFMRRLDSLKTKINEIKDIVNK